MSRMRQLLIDRGSSIVLSRAYLDSVILGGSIARAFARVVRHYVPIHSTVLDITHRNGAFWELCREEYRVVGQDIDLRLTGVDVFADARHQPWKRQKQFQAIVFDPPWSDDASNNGKPGRARRVYNAAACGTQRWDDMLHGLGGELVSLLADGGTLICRIQDAHHAGQFRDNLRTMERALCPTFAVWDRVIHVCGGMQPRYAMVDPPKTRKVHAYFLVMRKVIWKV